ncbi:hypothetical protein PG985_008474 [Apiospora marii]|uniref:uncharacterized protein n=1 Tax=Apiospora marii TaxID=335849 RepID=UPI00312FA306
MCHTIVAHHYSCGHTVRQYFETDPICLPGPELCRRVGSLRHHHFYWNQVTDWPSPLHEINHRYGVCQLCAAHPYYRDHSDGDHGPWTCFLKTMNLAQQAGFAEQEEICNSTEAVIRYHEPLAGWCPELLPAVKARLDQVLWDAPDGVPLEDLSTLDDLADDHSRWWCDGVLKRLILHGNAQGASLLMHVLRHIKSLPLGGPEEWNGLVVRVAQACGMWRCFAPKPEVFDGVERVAVELGCGIDFGNEERRAYRDLKTILEEHHNARDIGGEVLHWLRTSTLAFDDLDGDTLVGEEEEETSGPDFDAEPFLADDIPEEGPRERRMSW